MQIQCNQQNIIKQHYQMYPTPFFIIRQIQFFPTFFQFDLYNELFLIQLEIFTVRNNVTFCVSHLRDKRGSTLQKR